MMMMAVLKKMMKAGCMDKALPAMVAPSFISLSRVSFLFASLWSYVSCVCIKSCDVYSKL